MLRSFSKADPPDRIRYDFERRPAADQEESALKRYRSLALRNIRRTRQDAYLWWFRQSPRKKQVIIAAVVVTVLAAFILPIVFLVIAPRIAQRITDDIEINIDYVSIIDPTETQFGLIVNGGVKVNDDGFSFLGDKVFVDFEAPPTLTWINDNVQALGGNGDLGEFTAPLPSLVVQNNQGRLDFNATINITRVENMRFFTRTMVREPSFTWEIWGPITARRGFLKFPNLMLRKKLTIKGFNGLTDANVTKFDFLEDDASVQGLRLKASSSLINPSPIDVDLGCVDFVLSFDDTPIGNLLSKEPFHLKSGKNTINFEGVINPVEGPNSFPLSRQRVTSLMSRIVAGNDTAFSAVGRRAFLANNKTVSWMVEAFKGHTLKINFQSSGEIQLLSNVQLGQLGLGFQPATPNQIAVSVPNVTADMKGPFSFFVAVNKASMNVFISNAKPVGPGTIDTTTSPQQQDQTPVGKLSFPLSTAEGDNRKGKVRTGSTNATLAPIPGFETKFAEMVRNIVMESAELQMSYRGEVDLEYSSAVGNTSLERVVFLDVVSLTGLGLSKSTSQLTIQGLDPTPPTNGFDMTVKLDMNFTPSLIPPLTLNIGTGFAATFNILAGNESIGTITLPDLGSLWQQARGPATTTNGTTTTTPGGSTGLMSTTARVNFAPQTQSAVLMGRTVISSFLRGQPTPLRIVGGAPQVPAGAGNTSTTGLGNVLQLAFSQVALTANVPGIPGTSRNLIAGLRFIFGATGSVTAEVTIQPISPATPTGGPVQGAPRAAPPPPPPPSRSLAEDPKQDLQHGQEAAPAPARAPPCVGS
ncbi:hypothetical protein HK102_006323 [Quaeritorhiza haematococci]|nr:hypothetical protein HK102_006323 [Quaeritorhiza haematococci]